MLLNLFLIPKTLPILFHKYLMNPWPLQKNLGVNLVVVHYAREQRIRKQETHSFLVSNMFAVITLNVFTFVPIVRKMYYFNYFYLNSSKVFLFY